MDDSSPAPFSGDFIETTRREAERLRLEAANLRDRGDQLVAQGEKLLGVAADVEHRVRSLDELLGQSKQLNLEYQDEALRGERLREEAILILARDYGLGNPIHYKVWYAMLEKANLRAGGKNPVATFLTQITRSPLVERADGPAGTYLVNPERAAERAAASLYASLGELRAAEEALHAAPLDQRDALEVAVRAARRSHQRARRELEGVARTRSRLDGAVAGA